MFKRILTKKNWKIGINNKNPEYTLDVSGNTRTDLIVAKTDIIANKDAYVGRNVIPGNINSNIGTPLIKWHNIYSQDITINNICPNKENINIIAKSITDIDSTGVSDLSIDNKLYDYPANNGGDVNISAGNTISTSNMAKAGDVNISAGEGNYLSKHGDINMDSYGDINMKSNTIYTDTNNYTLNTSGFSIKNRTGNIFNISDNIIDINGEMYLNGQKQTQRLSIKNGLFSLCVKEYSLYKIGVIGFNITEVKTQGNAISVKKNGWNKLDIILWIEDGKTYIYLNNQTIEIVTEPVIDFNINGSKVAWVDIV